MIERTTTRALPDRTLPLRLIAAALAALLLAALAVPAAGAATERTFLVPAGVDLPVGSHVVGTFPVADALVVTATEAPPGGVAFDEPVGFQSLLEPVEGEPRLDSGVATTGAPAVWDETTGADTVVALVDTGVAPVPALEDAVAGEIDFTGTGGGDGYGHGTFLASLIAARGELAPGVAPGTGVLSLKVADDEGASDLGTVMSALQWLYGPGRAAGVRIAALALGVDADSPAGELLDLATARLADDGVLVVTASGNDGPDTLTSPATSPGTFSVGAVDDQGTPDRSDDVVATFSGSGEDRVGVAQPDLHAPGVNVVGWIDADSAIARDNPQALVDDADGLIRGSGTSMSTALAAGVAALALSDRPDLDGEALDEALRAAAGELDAPTALEAVRALPERKAPPPGQAAGAPPAHAQAGPGKNNGKAQEIPPVSWLDELAGPTPKTVRWATVRWAGQPWGHQQWGTVRWGTVRWATVRWAGTHWADEAWGPAAWGTVRWASDAGWQGETWTGEDWQTVRWATVRWATVRWATVRWATVRWAADWS